jgi:hypothetical protein
MDKLEKLIQFVSHHDGIRDKHLLSKLVAEEFSLVLDRKFYYCEEFAIRFSSSASSNFSNTVMSLSQLRKVDDDAFFVFWQDMGSANRQHGSR